MRILMWIVRGLAFFALFGFALNNQHDVVVHGFFGQRWQAPLVIVVLAAFALGSLLGLLAMMPSWWRRRQVERRATAPAPAPTPTESTARRPLDVAVDSIIDTAR
jgi:lipopolysaccharide assembly protein A